MNIGYCSGYRPNTDLKTSDSGTAFQRRVQDHVRTLLIQHSVIIPLHKQHLGFLNKTRFGSTVSEKNGSGSGLLIYYF